MFDDIDLLSARFDHFGEGASFEEVESLVVVDDLRAEQGASLDDFGALGAFSHKAVLGPLGDDIVDPRAHFDQPLFQIVDGNAFEASSDGDICVLDRVFFGFGQCSDGPLLPQT